MEVSLDLERTIAGNSEEAHDASKASIQSRISNLESGGVKGTGSRDADIPPAFKQEEVPVHMNQDSSKHPQKRIQMSFLKGLEVNLYVPEKPPPGSRYRKS